MLNRIILVIHVNLYVGSIFQFISTIKNQKQQKNLLVSATGAHGIIIAKNKNFKTILNSFYANLPNGMLVIVWAIN